MDELDALFSDAPAANLNVRFGIDANPDQAAESIRLARRYKLPVGVVSEFREDYKAKAKTEDAREVVDKSPALRSWIAESTQNAEISHDDVDNLSGLEQAIRTLKSIPRAIGSAFPQAGAGLYGAAAAPFEVAGQGFRMAEDAIADLLGAPRGMGRNVGEMVGGALREQQQSAQAVAEGVFTPPQDAGIIERGVGSGFQSATQTLLTLPIALRQGGEKLALGAMGLIEGGLSYGKARQAGLTPAQSAVFGVEQGVAEVVTESIPLGKLLGDIGAKSGAGQMLVNNLVREIPGELAATTWQSFNEWLTLNPEKSVGDWAAQLPEELAQTVVATLVGGGAQVGVIKGVQAVGDRMASADQKMQDAERTVQTMTQLDALAKASKVRQRDAVTFEEFIDKATEDGPLQDVYISGAALMQTGLAEKLAQVSQTVAEQIDVAVATGGDVRIPIAEYAGRIAGTDMSAALIKHLKTSENGLSQTEAKEWVKEFGESLKGSVERTLGETAKTQETLVGRDAVQAKVLDKLNATKRFTPDVNAVYATQMANFFAVNAARAGTTPEALFAQYEPRFVAESVTGQSLAQTTLTADESGMPEITGDDVFIGFSQPAERIEFIPGDSGEQMVNMAIMSPSGEYQGYIEATFKNGKPVAIYDIDVSPEARGSGVGVNAVKALLDTSEGGKLEISNILPQAQGFWEKLGIGVQNVEEGATYDGTITAESFAASPAGKKRRAAGRDAQGNAQARAGAQGTQGDALNQGVDQTETPEFKAWFGDSKVVDENGKPLVVYHGTNATFDTFRIEKIKSFNEGVGLYFTNNPIVAGSYGKPMQVYLSLQKPLAYDAPPFKPAVAQKVLKRAAEIESVRNDMDIEDGFLSNYGDVRSDGLPRVLRDAAAQLAREDSANDQIAGLFNGGLPFDVLAKAVRDVTGHDGFVAKGFSNEGSSDNTIYVAWFPEQIKSAIGNRGTFDPNDPSILAQGGARPKAQFFPDSRTIALLKDANLTSVLHESAHFYLEILTDLARTSPTIRQDVDATLKWFGIEGDENQSALDRWNSLPLKTPEDGGPAKEPYHEMWARGFEAFLFEGKSPSPEMLSVFQRFRAWMVNVYKSIKALNVELTDEVRGVFERMLATPEQIEAAKAAREMGLMFASEEEARKFGVDWGDYQAKGQQATEQAVTDLDKRSLRDMQWLSNAKAKRLKELQQKHEAIRREIEREVRADVMTRPVYRAWQLLTAKEGEQVRGPDDAEAVAVGRAKLNTEELKDTYGTASDAPWRRLISLRMTSTTEGVSPESIAEQVGFTSGDEMVRTLIDAVPPKEVIQAETDQAMLERYGDITSPEALERAADEAVHNDMRQRVVATELTALEKAVGAGKTLTTAAKQFAQDMIAGLKVRDLRPAQYATAAARAGVIAQRALKKNDIREAATQKRNQLIQGYASKAATKAQEEVDAGLEYLHKVEASKSIDPDYRDQIDTILERFDLKRGTSLKTIDKRKALSAWINDQEEMGVSPDLPPDVVNEALRKSYKDMTVEEFRGLLDSIKQIEHLGRLKKKLLTAKDKRDFEAIRDELVASIEANAKGKVDNRTRDTLMSGAIRLFNGFLVAHRKTASLAREMDGFKDGGPMWEYLIRTMNEAGDQEAVGREKATMALAKLMQPVLKGQKLSGKGQFFASLGISLNRGERLVMAMNTGNAGNLQRLLDGRGWTIDQIRPALDTLTAEDWQFVQSVWDFFESFRPQIAEKERRVMGKEPDWVEPTPVVTKFGTLRGGYYPVVYDPRESGRAENFANAEQAKQELKGAFVASTTRRSFTKTRAAEVKGRPLLLTMDALFNGANEVIHDLAWHEWVIDANRILRNDQIDSAIRNSYGAEAMASLKQAVKDIAAGETGTVDAFTKVLTPLRTGSVVAGLGFNLTNALLQPLGLTQSMVRIGTRWVALGIGEWAKSPVGLVKRVHEKSDFMRLRAKTQQRELNEIQSVVKGKSAMRAKMDALMFMPMTSLQLVADMPTWWGAYQKALAQGNEEARSIELADQSVIDAQGAGQTKDLSAIQRGHPLLKLFTTFYGFFNVAYNLGVERAKATNYRSPLDVMHLAWDFLLLYSVPSVLAALIKEAVSGGDDDDEELARKLAGEQISFLMGQMVGLRELTGAAQYATGTKQFDMAYGGPAGLRFVQEIDKLGKQIGQGDVDRALTRALVNVAGVTMHLPSGQINRTIDGVIAMSEGKTENPSAILFGPPKE